MRSRSPSRFARSALVLLLGIGTVTACSVNPATGDRQLNFIGTEQEIQMGREADQSVVESMGLYDDDQLQAYVSEMGQEMAAASERPELPWTFRVVDEPMINAFALPGGFIYITRGILAHFNSGAQLAAVMGHEIGHVTAQHSVNQLSRAQLAQVGLAAGSILSPEVAQFQGLLSTGLQLAFLKFGRDDERESDMLGLRYMTEAGYDPTEMPGVFRMLAQAGGGGTERAPEWLSTHPDPENREQAILDRIREMPVQPGNLAVEREEYVRMLDGIVFGDDPRNGYFVESTFLHPDMRFRFEFPSGWQTVNQRSQVIGQAPEGDAIIGLRLAEESSAGAALESFFSDQAVRPLETQQDEINGLPAALARFRAETEQGVLAGTVAFVEYGDRVFQLLGFTTEQQLGRYQSAFEQSIGSFDSLRDRRLIEVEPRRVEIVRVPSSMTLEAFDRRSPSTIPMERLSVLNQVEPGERMEAGRLVKRVVGEGPPES